jgi:hypothetical protein
VIDQVKSLDLLMTNLWMDCRLHRRNSWMIPLGCILKGNLWRMSRRIVVDIGGGLGISDLALGIELGNDVIGIDGGLVNRVDRSFPMVSVLLALLLDLAGIPTISVPVRLLPFNRRDGKDSH